MNTKPKTNSYEAMLEASRERQRKALKMQTEDHKSLKEIGDHFGVSRERARQMIAKAMREATTQ